MESIFLKPIEDNPRQTGISIFAFSFLKNFKYYAINRWYILYIDILYIYFVKLILFNIWEMYI